MKDLKIVLYAILEEVTKDHKDVFFEDLSINEKLQLLTTESMLALVFVSAIEDELNIELNDDEIDLEFFSSLDLVAERVAKYLN